MMELSDVQPIFRPNEFNTVAALLSYIYDVLAARNSVDSDTFYTTIFHRKVHCTLPVDSIKKLVCDIPREQQLMMHKMGLSTPMREFVYGLNINWITVSDVKRVVLYEIGGVEKFSKLDEPIVIFSREVVPADEGAYGTVTRRLITEYGLYKKFNV